MAKEKKSVHKVQMTEGKAFATYLKTIYHATDEKKALAALDKVTEKLTTTIRNWGQVYGELCIMF